MAKNGGSVFKGITNWIQIKTHLEEERDLHDRAKSKVLIKMAFVILHIKVSWSLST